MTIDTGRCAHDTVDGETLVIDTVTGHVLLLAGIGSAIWDRLRAPTDAEALADEADERYPDDDAADAVREFLTAMNDAGLVVPAVQDGTALDPEPPAAWPDTYAPPSFERFDEIADIMAMDPVHEVDTKLGWPYRGPGPGG